jgi:tetratricopeptide (TPR) repeat protein
LALIKNSGLSSEYATLIRAGALNALSFIVRLESPVEADRLLEESLQLFKSINSNFWIGVILENMGVSQIKRKDRIALFEESISVRRTQGDLGGIAHSLLLLSCETAWQLRFQEAEQLAFKSLAIYHDIAYQYGVVLVYRYLCSFYVWQGKLDESRVVAKKMLDIGNELVSAPSLALSSAISVYPDLYLGEYKAATKQAYSSLATCKKGNHVWHIVGCAHAISIIGKIALAVRSYPDAQKHIQESISIFQDIIEEKDSVGQDLACLGYIARKKDRKHQAKTHFLDALRLAIEVDGFLALFHTLPGIALLFADQGDIERAVELFALASTLGMVANSKWFADIAGDEIAAAAKSLPPEVTEAAKARGRARDLWETANELLQELEKRGWNEGV